MVNTAITGPAVIGDGNSHHRGAGLGRVRSIGQITGRANGRLTGKQGTIVIGNIKVYRLGGFRIPIINVGNESSNNCTAGIVSNGLVGSNGK